MSKPFETCTLHIGAEKTGSTSIQAFLQANRDRLLSHGTLFPRSPGDDNQPALAAIAQEDKTDSNLMGLARVRKTESLVDFRARIQAAMDAEVAAATAAGATRLVLTNEHCHSRIRSGEDAARLAGFLNRYSDDIRIIFYIRRQDLAAASLLTTALKMGHSRLRPQMNIETSVLYYNYWRLCEIYEETFGPDALSVRLFDRDHFVGGDLITDFCAAAGLPMEADWELPPPQNRSIEPVAQRFLSRFNKERNKGEGKPKADPYRRDLIAALEELYTGRGVMPPRAFAQDFLKLYRWGNEKLRKRYFPDLPAPLFGDDFSMYGDAEHDWMPAPQAALGIGARLWIYQEERIEALEKEIRKLKAEKADG